MNLNNIYIVLDHPDECRNIGSACRAMANNDITHLRIVGKKEDYDTEKVHILAIHAAYIYDNAEFFDYIPIRYKYTSLGCAKDFFNNAWIMCSDCKKMFADYDLFPVKAKNGETKFYCPDCIVDKVKWCKVCGEAFETNDMSKTICDDCLGGDVVCKTSMKSKNDLKK